MPPLGLGLGLGVMGAGVGSGLFRSSLYSGTKDVSSTVVGEKIASPYGKVQVDNSGGSATTVIGFGDTLKAAIEASSETIAIGAVTIIDVPSAGYMAWSSSETKTNVITQGN